VSGSGQKKFREVWETDLPWAIALAVVFAVLWGFADAVSSSLKNEPEALSVRTRVFLLFLARIGLFATGLGLLRVSGFPWPSPVRWSVSLSNRLKTEWRNLRLLSAWSEFVGKGRVAHLYRIRAAIAKAYFSQELDDLSGEADSLSRTWSREARKNWEAAHPGEKVESRPIVVTNFIRYVQLVRGMLEGGRRALQRSRHSKRRTRRVICITATPMGLTKWLNFDARSNSHPVWESYLTFLRQSVVPSSDFILARIVLVQSDGNPQEGPIRHRAKLAEDMQQLVWEDLNEAANPVDHHLVPIGPSGWRDFQGVWPDAAPYPKALKGDRAAYIIVDPTKLEAGRVEEVRRAGRFRKLGDAFIHRFHSAFVADGHLPSEEARRHAYYAVVDPDHYNPNKENAIPPNPMDFFYVGFIDVPDSGASTNTSSVDATPRFDDLAELPCEGLFCLAGRADSTLSMVSVSLVDPERCPTIFAEINEYVRKLLRGCHPLSELMTQSAEAKNSADMAE